MQVYTRNSALVHSMTYGEFSRTIQDCSPCPSVPNGGNDWTGDIGFNEAKRQCVAGSTALVADAQRIIDSIPLEQLPQTNAYQWQGSVTGAYANVPDYLSGHPASMRQRIKTLRDTAPLRIYAGVSAHTKIKGRELQNHFNALLAFSLLIERTRPVELYVVQGSKDQRNGSDRYLVIKVDNRPLSLAQACFALSVGCKRQLYFAYLHERMDVDAGIPRVKANSDVTLPIIWGSEGLPSESETPLYFPAVTPNAISSTSPVEWVTRMLKEYLTIGVCRAI
jgi:hypothetical protein